MQIITFSDRTVKNLELWELSGVTSFFPSKTLGCYGDGGCYFTNDDELAYKMRGIVNHRNVQALLSR